MITLNDAVNTIKRHLSGLVSGIKDNTFDSRITNLNEIPVTKFPNIMDVNVLGDTTSEVLEDLNVTLSSHLEDIKNKIEPTKIDFSSVLAKLDTLKDPEVNKEIEKLLTTISKKEVSFKTLEKQLASIEKTFKEHYNKKKDKKKELDYTEKFDGIQELLSNIYIPTAPKVIGVNNSSGERINPATEDKQDDIITAIQEVSGEYNTNDIDEASSTVTYIGMEREEGNYLMKKIDTSSGNSFQYASVNNNSGYTTYNTAWAARTSLSYANYGDVL
jgi:hypothetical protein